MKLNLPVTQCMRAVPPHEILVSQTDPRGVITYANSTFAEVSGYEVAELVGASHNIVRHPDMPQRLFRDLWATLGRGEVWRGLVKNRCKNGDHYWVDALVMPMREDGAVTGYLSVRRCAAPADIAAAEREYAQLAVAAPDSAPPRRRWLDPWLSIRSGVVSGIVVVMALLLGGAAVGLDTMGRAERAMADVQREAVEAANALARIKFLMADNRSQLMLGVLHDPRNPLSASHNHPRHLLSVHLDRIAANRAEIDGLWSAVRDRLASSGQAELVDRYWAARMRYVGEGLQPAAAALIAADYALVNRRLVERVTPLYDEANAWADELIARVHADAARRIAQEREHFGALRRAMVPSLAVVLLAMGAAGFLFLRSAVRPVEDRIDDLKRMAEGNLTARIPVDGCGEIGRLNRAFAGAQAQLQCLLDHLSRDATAVSAESARLKKLTLRLNDGIDEQHARIHRLADRVDEAQATAAELSQRAEAFMGNCERVAAAMESRTPAGEEMGSCAATRCGRHVAGTAQEIATDARVLLFLGEEMVRDSTHIVAFLAEHREAMHALWWAAGRLAESAADIEQSANRFEIG